jgi:hypothetical protein
VWGVGAMALHGAGVDACAGTAGPCFRDPLEARSWYDAGPRIGWARCGVAVDVGYDDRCVSLVQAHHDTTLPSIAVARGPVSRHPDEARGWGGARFDKEWFGSRVALAIADGGHRRITGSDAEGSARSAAIAVTRGPHAGHPLGARNWDGARLGGCWFGGLLSVAVQSGANKIPASKGWIREQMDAVASKVCQRGLRAKEGCDE